MTRAYAYITIGGERCPVGNFTEKDPWLTVLCPIAGGLYWIITHSDANEPLEDCVCLDTVNLEDGNIISQKVIAHGRNDADTREDANTGEETTIEVFHIRRY